MDTFYQDQLFDLLVECAVARRPCPRDPVLGARLGLAQWRVRREFDLLAMSGRVSREYSDRYGRIVTIGAGPHSGKVTARNTREATVRPHYDDRPMKPPTDALPENCFAAHNLPLRSSTSRIAAPGPARTLGGIGSAWMAG